MAKGTERSVQFPDGASRGATFIGVDRETGERVYIEARARAQATTLVGVTGSGKTNTLLGMLTQDMWQGRSVVLAEPHGDLTAAVVGNIPQERLPDTILLNVQEDASFGLNPFECADLGSPTEVAKTAAFLFHAFTAIWSIGPETPQLTQTLRHLIRLCIEAQATLDMIPLILGDDALRARLLTQVRNAQTRAFFEAYGLKSRRDRELQVSSVVNKLDALLAEPLIARILCQKRSTIDFGKAMREGRIVLILLPPALEEAANLLGSLLISRILLSVFHRAEVAEGERREVALYCDEYSRFASPDFAVLLAESRKFGLLSTIAFQHLSMLDPVNQAAAQTAGTLIVFRVSGQDSKVLAPSFKRQPSPQRVGDEPVRAIVNDPVTHLTHRGHPHPAVSQLVSQYLLPLGELSHYVGSLYGKPLYVGPCDIRHLAVIEAKRLLGELLTACMRTGRSDLFVDPLILFLLAAAAGDGGQYVFAAHLKKSLLSYGEFIGFRPSASQFGQAGFLENRQAVADLLTYHATKRVFSHGERVTLRPGAALLRLLRLLRESLAVLAREPLTTETGLYQPRYQSRLYSDVQGEIENALVTMPPYHARVRLVTGEHIIKTHPAPQGLTGELLKARISRIMRQNQFLGYTRKAADIDEELRKRQERWRG